MPSCLHRFVRRKKNQTLHDLVVHYEIKSCQEVVLKQLLDGSQNCSPYVIENFTQNILNKYIIKTCFTKAAIDIKNLSIP